MILTCPACGTRYAVKDGAIPPGGRQVRCASCKHSWHQDPDESALAPEANESAGAPAAPVEAAPEEHPSPTPMTHSVEDEVGKPAEAALSDHAHPDLPTGHSEEWNDPDAAPLPEPAAAAPLPEEPDAATMGWSEPQEVTRTPSGASAGLEAAEHPSQPVEQSWAATEEPAGHDFADYIQTEEEEPRRRGWIGLLLALLLIAAAVAAFWFFAPAAWKERLGLSQTGHTPLLVQVDERNRRTLESGNEILEISGKVINPTDREVSVPPLQAQLRSTEQKVVLSWTITPPVRVLPAGASAPIYNTQLDIPSSAACLDVFFDKQRLPNEPCRAAGATAPTRAG